MKKLIIALISITLFSCNRVPAQSHDFKEHISKTFSLQNIGGSLAVYNISGSIKVTGYSGDKILIEIDKTISADNNQAIEAGKKEFRLEFEQIGDSITIYIAEPYDSRPRKNTGNHWHEDRKIEYSTNLNFIVKVPYNTNLHVSTVNDGDIKIEDVAGKLRVNNINGGINISNAKGTTDAHTINGNLTINYSANPPEPSSFYTLNGELNVTFPSDLSADLQFKSMNGEFFTDFPNTEILPATVIKTNTTKNTGTVYKLNKNTSLRVGNGGKIFKFETLNGNIYIKKQS